MKRRVLSLIIALALCLNLCPMWAFAADDGTGGGLCPHHPAHTDECGYREPTLEQECTHIHDDGCYTTETDCIHAHTAECYSNPDYDPETDEPDACTHVCAEDSGCVTRTLSCPHEHDDTCGYAPADPGALCAFVCRVCPIDGLIGKLPAGVSAYNSEQVQAQLNEIYALYDQLSYDEQQQVDLSRCAALQEQIDEMGIAAVSDDFPGIPDSIQGITLPEDKVYDSDSPYEVKIPLLYNTNGYTLSCPSASVLKVTGAGQLYLTGTVTSGKGAGVEVQPGGLLSVKGEATAITGKTYALDIASGATVQLAAGTYSGGSAAIRMAGGDFADLLAPGYAFFDGSGNPILSVDAAAAKTLVVKECTDHFNKTYVANTGAITHKWTCQVCKAEGTEPCTFTFDENGKGTCALCGNEVTVMVNRESLKELAYDTSNSGSVKPANGTVTVTAKDGTTLTEDADYAVDYSVHADVGNTSVTVKVTVVMGTGNGTFTKDYLFTQADLEKPVLEWDTTVIQVPVTVPYDGDPVEAGELPPVTINITSDVDLHQYLQYSYKASTDTAYTDGLPTNAGTYDVVVSLPEKPVDVPNYEAASSEPITLIINKISPILTPPAAIELTFDRTEQTLVTAGTLHSAAARDGVVIKFATSESGTYSTTIPTGINAGEYDVWYQTEETENFLAVGPLKISGVEIQRKLITPIVTLSQYTYLYTGGYHQPGVEVKDEDNVTVLLDTEYAVKYDNNRNVSTDGNPATVEVSDKPGGNYAIQTVTVEFKITLREQETLSITNKPDTVVYGAEFTLSTLGGSGNGNVTWEIVTDTGNDGSATVNATSGRVKITGAGTITIKATKSGVDPETNIRNYDDATATWTFVADKKSVVATVTAEDKDYNGDNIATIHAVVEQGVLPGDTITISGLEGTFSDANAGVDKLVTVDVSKVTVQGANSQHYDVSYSSLTVTATIRKAVAKITTPPVPATLIYDGTEQALIATGAAADPSSVPVEYALSEEGPYFADFPKATNAGTYTVWYRVQETPNYTGLAPASVDVEIEKKPVTPEITLSGEGLENDDSATAPTPTQYYIYDGTAKEPTVTLEDESGNLIPADEYTVAYSSNTNVGTATVTVKAKDEGNYSFNVLTKDFRIDKEKAKVVTAPKMAGDPLTYNTRAQQLVTEGTGAGGTMVYCVGSETGTYLPTIPTAVNAGDYTVYYKVKGDGNHSDSDVGQVTVTIAPKTVKDPTIELELVDDKGNAIDSYTYDGNPKKPAVVVKDGSTVIGTTDTATGVNNEYNVIYTNNVDAGTATVNITDKFGGNYTVTGSTTFVIVKADIVFNPAPSAASITYDGKPHELLNPGATNGGEVLYALNSPTTTYTAAIPQATEAGDYTVYYKVTGDKNHNDLAVQSVPVTIQRKPLTTITIELTPDSFVYDGQAHLPEVTVKDGNTVLPEEEYEWECTLNGVAEAAPTNQGKYTITVTDLPNGNYDLTGVTANTKTFNIGKAAQAELVIDHSNAVTTNYGDTFTLTATGGSSTSDVEWSVTSGTAATVDADTGAVEITGVGEVTITATKPGDGNYLPGSVQWSFTAAPKPVTAFVTVADRAYNGATDATVASAVIDSADLVNSGDDVTIDETSITAEFDTASVGTDKTVTLDTSNVKVDGADAEKYAISYPSTVTAEIERANTAITTQPAEIDPLTYNGQPQALVTAGKSNVGFIVYSLNGTDFSPEIPTGTDAKIYEVFYKVVGTADYTEVPVNAVPITVTIAPKAITPVIEPEESSYLYDSTKHEPKITVKDGKTVIDEDQYTITWENDDPAITDDILTAAGSYTATIKNKTGGNYLFSATATVEIVPAAQAALNITGQPEHVYYGDKITTLSTSGGSGNGTLTWSITSSVTSSAINSATGELMVKDTGSITVKAERVVPNYGTVSDTWTFTVEPRPVMAEVTVTGKVYDGSNSVADGDIKAEVKESDLVNAGDSVTISGLTGTYDSANVGTNKTVTLNDADIEITTDPDKYTVVYPATAKADITARPVDVTVTLSGNDLQTDHSVDPPEYSYAYDGTEKTPTVTVTGTDAGGYSAPLAASDYTFSYSNNKNVGTASVTVECAAGGNYTFTSERVTFEIKSAAAKLTSTPQAKKLTYDGTLQDLVTVGTATGGTVVYSLSQIDPDDPSTYSEIIPQGQNAGVYTVYYMVKGDANHEDAGGGYVSVTIDPKEITPKITLDTPGPFVYNGSVYKPAVTVKDGNTVIGTTDSTTGENSEYTVDYRDNINAGTAAVIVSNKNGGNYIVNGTAYFTITKAAPTYTPPVANPGLQYNGALQDLVKAGVTSHGTVVYSVNGGNYTTAIPAASAVGAYTIDYKVLGDANHSDTDPAALTVDIDQNTVNTPTISLSADTFKYNGSQQKPTIIVYDDSGAVIPEREYEVTITGSSGNHNMVDVGAYTVKITTPSTSNYVITDDGSNTRTFTIVPADQETISITGTQAKVSYGDTIQLGTTGGTGTGTVTWTVTDANGDPVNSTITAGGLLTVLNVGGPITVTAKRSMGNNYGDVSAAWEFSPAKKAVTAVVTADDRPYDADDDTATVHAAVPDRELVPGDSITIDGLTGKFDDASAGTNKKVTIDSSKAEVKGSNSGNYEITYPAAATASILAATATVADVPEAVSPLTYDASQSQALVTAGTATGGTMVYSLDGTNFTPAIPKAKDAGDYTVYYKAQGDGNHTDSAVGTVEVTIDKQTVAAPQIELTPPAAQYDGQVKRPEVTVRDSANNVIPISEYKATYVTDGGKNWMDKGTYTVKIEDITGGNYVVTTAAADFTISTTAQNPLEITNKPGLVYYGDTFTLSAVGGSGSAAVTWSTDNDSVVEIDNNGFVRIIGTGSATITAEKAGGTNYDTVKAAYPLNTLKKPITAIVTADDKVYDGVTPAKTTLHVTWKDGDLVGNDKIDTSNLVGTFADELVGTNKTVNISGGVVDDSTAQKYDITIPSSTTASILKADADAPSVSEVPRLEYNGSAQILVTSGDANTLYSNSRDGIYSAAVPTGTNAGTYTVWYKAKGDNNHNDSEAQSIQVTISRKTLTVDGTNATLSGSDMETDDDDGTYYYVYDGTEKKPSVVIKDGGATVPASEYEVSYSGNKNVGDATVTITNAEGGNYVVSGTVSFEIREGDAVLTSSPQARDLTYTGQAQELVTIGTASGGHIEYLLVEDADANYSTSIPTATDAGTYTVNYKVVGDDNHADSATTGSVTVIIKPKEIVSPVVTVDGSYTYDGTAKVPAKSDVKVKDGSTEIPNTEYTFTCINNTDAGTATVVITNANGGNYIVNGTGAFTIGKADVAADMTPPEGLENLPYNGAAQALVKAGNADGGTVVYSLNKNGEYSAAIPTATAVDNYTVWYKVQGDGNHKDTEPASVDASIIVNAVSNPTIQVEPETVNYTGEKQVPVITVKDGSGVIINGSEYEVTYTDAAGNTVTELTNVGKYTVTITGVSGGNYTFATEDGKNTADFEILEAGQESLTITNTREQVCYGDKIQLGTTGGNGTVTWKVDDGSTVAAIDPDGLLEITGVGSVTVTATSKATGYTDQTATWRLYADQKPVTAVVTAASKEYDGKTDATVTATLQASDLVNGDVITIELSGSFGDANVGTDKRVNVDSTNPDFSGSSATYVNYKITYPATTTASILKTDIDTAKDVTAPTAADAADLVYTGTPLVLVEAGTVTGGAMEYSTDGINFSASLPTGIDADDYDVWYRVKGDGNHNDIAAVKLDDQVTITRQEVTKPTIEFSPNSVSYDGAVHKPAVTVKDNNGRIIPDTEYSVEYSSTSDWRTAGDHTVTVKGAAGGNYDITQTDADFTILMMGQNPLSIGNQPGRVQYGDAFTLNTTGGSGTGKVTWNSTNPAIATVDMNSGLVTVAGCGRVEIRATKEADDNYSAVSASWTFSAEKKAVTPIVTAKDREYIAGKTDADLVITWKDGDLVGGDTITLNLTGTFNNADVGTDKTVTIRGTAPSSDKYDITIPSTTTASITPKAAAATVVLAENLEYTGSAQNLVSSGLATGGDVVYSLNGVTFTRVVPTGTNAGTYTFWYKALADENYKDSPVAEAAVTIAPKTVNAPTIELSPATFEYDGTAKKPDVTVKDGSVIIPASEYTVGYSNNTAVGATATVTISDVTGGNYTVNGTATFTITAGTPAVINEPQPRSLTYNGREQTLVTRGTAANGHMEYSLDYDYDYSTTLPKETNAGVYEVWYKVVGDDGTETDPESVIAEILPKSVNPTVTLNLTSDPLPYTGKPQKPRVTVAVGSEILSEYNDYTLTYSGNTNPGTATVAIQSVSGSNYQFYTTRTFEIAKAKAEFAIAPEAKDGLVYTGEAQELFEGGISLHGIVLYSKDTVTYTADIPTGTNVGSYTFFAKVRGDAAHEDSEPIVIRAAIGRNEPTKPNVVLTGGDSFTYTGSEIKPTVTVYDDNNKVIPATEYTVTYSNNINVGKNAAVTVTGSGKNYSFTASATFTIIGAGQTPLEITGKKDAVYYGDTLSLSTTGGNGGGAVTWTVSGPATKLSDGRFEITNSGMVTITATKAASTGYEAASDTWTFLASPRPATAIVTAEDKPYDGEMEAKLSVTVTGLLPGDTIPDGGVTAKGQFTDEKVGADKTVIITLTISEGVREKYDISCDPTTKASITQAPAKVDDTDKPEVATGLIYNGTEQALLANGGAAIGGNIMYSLDGGSTYSFNIPTGKDVGDYTVWYKVAASDENHKDTAPALAGTVTIAQNTEKPSNAMCSPNTVQYSGTAQTPAVDVLDSTGRPIPAEEYTVTVVDGPAINPGTYTVSIKDKPGGNYEFSDTLTASFEIVPVSQNPLSITDKPVDVHYGDKFSLSAVGGSGSGKIMWSIAGDSSAAKIEDGVVTVTGTGAFTVEAYREASGGYGKSNTDSVSFYADPKPITPVVTAANKPYDGNKTATLTAKFKDGDLVGGDEIELIGGIGVFETENVGTNTVSITPGSPNGACGNYYITWPESTTASISRVNAQWNLEPVGADNLTYTGNPQALIAAGTGTTLNGIGKVEYSTSQYGRYSEDIPTGTSADTYTVWYRVADDVNYQGIAATSITVEIAKADPGINTQPKAAGTVGQKLSDIRLEGGATTERGKFAWKDGTIEPLLGQSQQEVIFTPDNTANYKTVTFSIPVTITDPSSDSTSGTGDTPSDSTGGTGNTPSDSTGGSGTTTPSVTPSEPSTVQTTVQNGTASAVVSTAAGTRLVKEAIENQSQNIVIKPEITGDVTKTEVSIPASTVSQIKNQTNAALTVSAPIADVTIPNAALDTLGRAGGTVNVVTEQAEQAVVLTVTAGGKTVDSVPGGLTLTVPAGDAGPGTVAVLVHEDGTRETVQKSVVEDGKISVPLSGSATVEIVDNSKEFADVSPTSWEADAVAFASAHELFSGTSETTFSPDESMSRGMLATVLYRLEGCPDQEGAATYADVSSDAWYADGVAWVTENGIANGYGDDQFGPNDNITREQFAVMLWNYAGKPAASSQVLGFTDADQASSYALEALCWAAENGILSGYGNGQLVPGGTATRAQAAQMLKNFMENT